MISHLTKARVLHHEWIANMPWLSGSKSIATSVTCQHVRGALGLMLSVLLVNSLQGCALGPDYTRPEITLPTEYDAAISRDNISSDNNAQLPQVKWQDFYQDDTLTQLITQALTDNLDYAAAKSRLRAARAEMTSVDADFYPKLQLDTSVERALDSALTNTAPSPESTIDLLGSVSWEVDLWGESRRRSEASYAQYLSEEEALRLAKISLISDIARRYYEWMDIDQRYRISYNTLILREKAFALEKLRRNNGVISGLEVRQAQVEYQSTKVTLPTLDYQRKEKLNQLNVLVGHYTPSLLSSTASVHPIEFPAAFSVGVPSALLSLRPDVRIAELALIAANAKVGVAKTAFFPKFTITAYYGQESESIEDLFNSQGVTWSLLGGITAPIFNAGKISAQFDVATEEATQAMLRYRQTVLTAFYEVSDALNSYQRSEEAIKAQQDLISAANEYVKLARLRYTNGVATSLDLMDAQRQLFSAELALSTIKTDRQLAMINLYRSLGGGEI